MKNAASYAFERAIREGKEEADTQQEREEKEEATLVTWEDLEVGLTQDPYVC